MSDPATFKCGHERTPENSKPAQRWFTCRTCANASNNASARRRRLKERAERPQAPHRPQKAPRDAVAASERRVAAVRKRISAKARERIEQGLDARTASQAAVRHAQFAIEAENEQRARLSSPIEQAKASLRKRYTPVLSAETTGGPAGHFIVGRKLVDEAGLLEMARRAA